MKQAGSRIPIKTLVYASLSIAIVFVVTRYFAIPIRTPFSFLSSGYVNLGDASILVSSAFFGPAVGAIAGAFGSALSDLTFPGALIYAPFTFVIKGLEGLVAGLMFRKHINKYITVFVSLFIMVAGYFLAESFLLGLFSKTGGLAYAIFNLPFNVFQAVACGALFILVDILKRIKKL